MVAPFDALPFARPAADLLDVEVEVECSSGTYVRALARDLGTALGVGGHLTALRRTRVGPFRLDSARTLDELRRWTTRYACRCRPGRPPRDAGPRIDGDEARELSFGRSLEPRGIEGTHGALAPDGSVVALLREEDDRARPVLVFAAAG